MPILSPVTNQQYACWISLQESQDSLASSFLKQSRVNAHPRELGVMQSGRNRWVMPQSWPCLGMWASGMEVQQPSRAFLDFLDTLAFPTFVLNVLPYNEFSLS